MMIAAMIAIFGALVLSEIFTSAGEDRNGGNDEPDPENETPDGPEGEICGGNDAILGSSASDFLDGGGNDDKIFGGAGHDTIIGGNGADLLDGSSGNDTIYAASGPLLFEGGTVEWYRYDDEMVDSLAGGAGDDTLYFDQADQVAGGSGNDQFVAYFDPTKGGFATIDDFDPDSDEIEVVIRMNDDLVEEWSGQYTGDSKMELDASIEWVASPGDIEGYDLVVGGYTVVRVLGTDVPDLDAVEVTGFVQG